TIRPEGNRYLIGRIPVVSEDGTYTLKKKVDQDSGRNAARLHGNKESDDLTRELMQDRHLGPFLMIPSKDNGFDIEGLTAANNRLFIGLRGPVLRGWAIILEVEMKEDDSSHTTLRLKRIGPHDQCYRKHFVQLGGLGIRDLCTQGPDLLILAGPTMELDGPVAIFRWRCGAEQKGESIIPSSGLEHVMPIPYGEGEDHAEGMTLFTPDGGVPRSVFVVYDSCSKERRTEADATQADIFALPD
ncbi:MAG TPA: DUF3616 domain-containing protein, partial [Anaerolineales bacterium]|nr:DUF3616 domain-containing protein [Anaerolineales bacterium]